ncbi:MAG: minor capsid protein [Oscillospiraceae bacterium]
MGMTIKVTGLSPGKTANRIISDEVKMSVANNAAKLMADYLPMDTGTLMGGGMAMLENGNPIVFYNGPYAHFQHEGRLMLSPSGSPWAKYGEIKHYAKPNKYLKFSKEKHPLATSYWERAMIIGKGRQFLKETQQLIKRG